jgi:hypothetical protein
MLQIGDRLLTQDGRAVPVEGVAPSGQRATVYNWRIAEYHTYYVSAAEASPSLWAHNADYNVGAGASEAPTNPSRGVPDPSTPVGRRGSPLGSVQGNAPTTIGGRQFSGHAIDQMQARGVPPSVVENTIQHGVQGPGSNPTTIVHYDPVNNVSVAVDRSTGRVVTVSHGDLR